MRSPSSQDVAVSPAIGTILLVALTVVFVAVVVAVVMGISGGMSDMKSVGLTLEPYSNLSESKRGIAVTIYGGEDVGNLVSLRVSLDGRELIYRETETSSVENPAVGIGYQFKVKETQKTIVSYRGSNPPIQVTLTTTHIEPVSPKGFYVVVTGKFSDGTEQVLLVKNVVLPGIPAKGSFTDPAGRIAVRPESISTIEPDAYASHGFVIEPLVDGLELDWNSVTFEVKQPGGGTKPLSYGANSGLTPGKGSGGRDDGSFDVNSAILYKIDITTPYPDLNKFWSMGELTGTVTIRTMASYTPLPSETITVTGVTVPERANWLNGGDTYKGKITASGNTLSIKRDGGKKDFSTTTTYYSLASNPRERIGDLSKISSTPDDDTLEAYVQLSTGATNVWCKVASARVGSLRNS